MTRRAWEAAGVRLVVCAGCVLCLDAGVRAQGVDAVLEGTVTDQSGARLPGAVVVAVKDRGGLPLEAVTDGEGRYRLPNLPPGTYAVRASFADFTPAVREAQPLHVGTTVTLDLVVTLPGFADGVVVRNTAPVLETGRHSPGRIVQTAELDELPVVDRNFHDLAALAPGVTKTGVYGGVDIGGARDFQNAYQVDGVSVERQHAGDQRIAFAQDWIQEFQVITSNFNAEFGGAAGGVLNAVTRSGGNRVTARGYGFFRDDAWDATPALASKKAPLAQHRVGATVGGPLVRDRVFYFAGVELFGNESSHDVRSAFPSANGTFPSATDQTLYLGRADLAGGAHRLRVRVNGQRRETTGASIGGTSTEEHGRFSTIDAGDLAGAWTWVASPAVLNEARVAWSSVTPTDGCNFAARNPGGWFELSYPGARFGCPVNFGTAAEDQLQAVQNLTWVRGRHTVKLGAVAQWTTSHGDFRNFRDGRYSFDRDVPFSLSDPSSHPFSFVMIEGPTSWRVAGGSIGLFAQDSWATTSSLTLNFGVRYDVDGSFSALNDLLRGAGRRPVRRDADNVSPRAGFAWTPFDDDRRTLIRGGAGVFHDQNHNNLATTLLLNNVLVDRVVLLDAHSRLLNPFWPDIAAARRYLAEALARRETPDPARLRGVAAATNDIDRGLQVPAAAHASVGAAREISSVLSASADVVFTRGFDQYVIRNVNLDPVTFRPVDPAYSVINAFGNGGWTRYRGLHVQVHARTRTWHAQASYTLASTRSNTNATLSGGSATNPFDYSEDEGPADNDVRHVVSLDAATPLPWGFEVSGICSYHGALPYSAITSAPRPDGKPFAFRPEPRNARRGDSAFSVDLRIGRRIRLGVHSARVFLEAFNVTDAVNYTHYVGSVTSVLFGQPTLAGPPRRLQLGFRFDW